MFLKFVFVSEIILSLTGVRLPLRWVLSVPEKLLDQNTNSHLSPYTIFFLYFIFKFSSITVYIQYHFVLILGVQHIVVRQSNTLLSVPPPHISSTYPTP